MSGSGGFYKYRCKYFYTHNCPNWVLVNNSSCASCLADGRDSGENTARPSAWGLSREVYVPRVLDGTLHYTLMEIVATGEQGNYWTLRLKPSVRPPPPATATTGPMASAMTMSTTTTTTISTAAAAAATTAPPAPVETAGFGLPVAPNLHAYLGY